MARPFVIVGALIACGIVCLVVAGTTWLGPQGPPVQAAAPGAIDAATSEQSTPSSAAPARPQSALELEQPPPMDAEPQPRADDAGLATRAPTPLDAALQFLRSALPDRYGKLTAEELAALTVMDLRGAKVTDADLAHIAALPALESLSLHGTAITDAGLAQLRALPKLTALDLRATQVSGAGLWQMPAYQLEALHLTETRVSANDLRSLPSMPNLKTLKLNGLGVGDDLAGDLASLRSVRHLELDRTAITNDGLRALLAQNPDLQRIELRNTGVTREVAAELKNAHPGLELVLD